MHSHGKTVELLIEGGKGRGIKRLGGSACPGRRRAKPSRLAGGDEGGSVLLVGGHEAGDGGPEGGGVVDLTEVGYLVDQDVVDKAWRELEGGPVDVDT